MQQQPGASTDPLFKESADEQQAPKQPADDAAEVDAISPFELDATSRPLPLTRQSFGTEYQVSSFAL